VELSPIPSGSSAKCCAGCLLNNDEAMMASLADRIAQRRMEAGQELDWPPGMPYEDAVEKADYPTDIWQEAERRWRGLTPEKQEQARKEARQESAKMLGNEVSVNTVFLNAFSLWDGLWFFLATATAFRIGTGTYSRD